MSSVAVRTHKLSKLYRLGTNELGYTTLREAIVRRVRRPIPRPGTQAGPDTELWALRDLDIQITQGEVVGLIGHNGAGKSTLLKILARITEPTSGWAEITGRVGSLLEVGTGFHTELTGRENIFLSGSILGMRRQEILRRFDEIVEFAEIERFLDTPVKRYSSGMQVRLAFAVAAHLEPEILLVDEVLAVGDTTFQRKSLGKMGDVASQGRTVIFVSHNLAIIQALCRRGIVLENGRVLADAPIGKAVDHYLHTLERTSASESLTERRDRDARSECDIMITRVEVQDISGGHHDAVVGGRTARVVVHLTGVMAQLRCIITVVNSLGFAVTTFDSRHSAPTDVIDTGLGPRIECDVSALPLVPGRYRLDVQVIAGGHYQDGIKAAGFFDVEPGVLGSRPMPPPDDDTFEGNVLLNHTWRLPG